MVQFKHISLLDLLFFATFIHTNVNTNKPTCQESNVTYKPTNMLLLRALFNNIYLKLPNMYSYKSFFKEKASIFFKILLIGLK